LRLAKRPQSLSKGTFQPLRRLSNRISSGRSSGFDHQPISSDERSAQSAQVTSRARRQLHMDATKPGSNIIERRVQRADDLLTACFELDGLGRVRFNLHVTPPWYSSLVHHLQFQSTKGGHHLTLLPTSSLRRPSARLALTHHLSSGDAAALGATAFSRSWQIGVMRRGADGVDGGSNAS
jgi:hypothetical protein